MTASRAGVNGAAPQLLLLFQPAPGTTNDISLTADVFRAVRAGSPVAIGVSGGKDSAAAAFRTLEYLDAERHAGPRILIHSHLGRLEWRQSLPACRRLAERLGLDLIVVERQAGDLLDRWRTRWANNVRRYAELSCVKLILPWSTASMRFCTSELKTAVICSELVRHFPHQTILSVSGIRREESASRAGAPIARPQPKLTNATRGTSGVDWHPIIEWKLRDVLEYLEGNRFPLHEAYTIYGSSRVSCAFCVLSAARDLAAVARENVNRLRAALGLFNIEFDPLTLCQRPVSGHADSRVVHKHIALVEVAVKETPTFRVIKSPDKAGVSLLFLFRLHSVPQKFGPTVGREE